MKKELVNKFRKVTGLEEYHLVGPDRKREVYYGDYSKIKGVTSTSGGRITSENFPLIGSYGLGACIAIIGRDPKSKTTFMTHNVPIKKLDEINDPMINQLKKEGISSERLEFYLIGGNTIYEDHVNKIKRYLSSKTANPKIVYEDLIEKNDPKGLGKSVIIDSNTGNIFCHDGISLFN